MIDLNDLNIGTARCAELIAPADGGTLFALDTSIGIIRGRCYLAVRPIDGPEHFEACGQLRLSAELGKLVAAFDVDDRADVEQLLTDCVIDGAREMLFEYAKHRKHVSGFLPKVTT